MKRKLKLAALAINIGAISFPPFSAPDAQRNNKRENYITKESHQVTFATNQKFLLSCRSFPRAGKSKIAAA